MTCAGAFQGRRTICSLPRIDLVRRAQTGELGARGFESLDHISYAGKAVAGCRLDAAGREEILGECGPRAELSRPAEIGEENFGPGPRACEIGRAACRGRGKGVVVWAGQCVSR